MNFSNAKSPLRFDFKTVQNSILIVAFLCFFQNTQAQKKPIDHSVYDTWQSLGVKLWSADGKTALYQVVPQEGDKLLYIRSVDSNRQVQLARGENPVITSDSKYAISLVKPFYKDLREGKIKKKKDDELPKDSLAIMNLLNLEIVKIPLIKSFKIPEKGGSKLAYLLEKDKALKTVDSLKKEKPSAQIAAKTKDKNAEPLQLVLLDLPTGKQMVFENVVEYEFSKNGRYLALATQEPTKKEAKKEEKTEEEVLLKDTIAEKHPFGVYLVDTETHLQKAILEAKGEFSQFVFDETANRLAFIGTTDEKKKEVKTYRLYSSFKRGVARVLAQDETKGMPEKWGVSENSKPVFSKNGKKIFLGIAALKQPKDTTFIADDHAVLDVWHYKDEYLQSVQLKNLDKELKRTYMAVIHMDKPDFLIPLSDANLPELTLVDEGNADYVLGYSDRKGRVATQWNGFAVRDYYTVDLRNGKSDLIIAGLNGYAYISPLGKYIVYFNRDNGNWYSYNSQTKKHLQLNSGITTAFADEEFDMPDLPNAYGIAEWTDKDESVLIKDRYDIWEFTLNGSKPAKSVTNHYGRDHRIRFDINKFDRELRSISRKQFLILSAFNETTKEAGFYSTVVSSNQTPQKLQMQPVFTNSALIKAKEADVYMYAQESFTQAPSLFITRDFKTNSCILNSNPQQSAYNWGTASLIQWTTDTGKAASGILYKPENFDSTKKYPMIVYFYEKLTDNLNRYEAPAPTASRLNITYFVSNGYLVFTPDISYEKGYPGRSAEIYINSGVNYLKNNPWVDGDKIGIQGQSWGGYQVAHLITRTHMYAAAWAGAPVVNMTSAYGGIRWGTGMNRQFQYEKTQSRIGSTLWEARDLYIENSPLFFMDNVQTPVVIMHNDNDGAVPWYQGIEMFTALRRLDKPVWMLNYNGDEHNLMKRQNRKDIQIREQQFFDHYLKGAPMPVWMDTGVPAVLKGKTWGFELVN